MLIKNVKDTTFEQVSYDQWKEVAVQSLKGLPFEKLVTKTIENIDLKPLYTKDSPRLTSIEAIRNAKTQSNWTIAQIQYETEPKEFLKQLESSLKKGNEAIVYDGANPVSWDEQTLNKLSSLIMDYPIYFVNIHEDDQVLEILQHIPSSDKNKVHGFVECSATWLEQYPNIRTKGLSTIQAHHLGADAVTELALTLANASEQIGDKTHFEKVSKQLFVHMAIDTHFFMEIAKIRAFRILWQALSHAYDIKETNSIPIFAETSKRSYSTLDPYVNLLRAGNSAFSAVLGGVDVLAVHPHNLLTTVTPTSVRLARNIQLVIKDETYTGEVIDPSGGSYYIEALTKELVTKAWQLFLTIEAAGGYSTYTSSDTFIEKLTDLRNKRIKAIATGQHSLVGTSVYADLDAADDVEPSIDVEGRIAEPFEAFRHYFKAHQPRVALVNFGLLKDYKPRADFITGYFATAGIHVISSPGFEQVKDAIDWAAREDFDHLIICAPHKRTIEIVDEIVDMLPKGIIVDVAGKYDDENMTKWRAKGINGFIFQGSNKLEKFEEMKQRLKGDDSVE